MLDGGTSPHPGLVAPPRVADSPFKETIYLLILEQVRPLTNTKKLVSYQGTLTL